MGYTYGVVIGPNTIANGPYQVAEFFFSYENVLPIAIAIVCTLCTTMVDFV